MDEYINMLNGQTCTYIKHAYCSTCIRTGILEHAMFTPKIYQPNAIMQQLCGALAAWLLLNTMTL